MRKVYVVSDDPIERLGREHWLNAYLEDIEVVGNGDKDSALFDMEDGCPDVVVVDPEGADEKSLVDDCREIKSR